MKFIKNHLMFILPLMAILLGIEFYLVFDRTTDSYEEGLKERYSMLVVSKEPIEFSTFKSLENHVSSVKEIERENIVAKVAKGIDDSASDEIIMALPYFYEVRLDSYLDLDNLEKIKANLKVNKNIKKVETFGSSHGSAYRLFKFIKFTLKLFLFFISIVSLFLIIKQMEIWKYAHKERMQVMEIFGAPLMLRSGILFKIAFLDAFIATFLTSLVFLYVKLVWAGVSGIDIIVKNQEKIFKMSDIGILLFSALFIVIIAVYFVVFSAKGVEE
ncbi:MAG: cell division protein FtsX [Sulfurovum sp.]|nr:MAG: cell division protein FtsX [Sulfurovum sp.]